MKIYYCGYILIILIINVNTSRKKTTLNNDLLKQIDQFISDISKVYGVPYKKGSLTLNGFLPKNRRPKRQIPKLPIIFPGTKYCGVGNISSGWDDLGIFEKTDRCCRQHDSCPDYASPLQWKHGMLNLRPYTIVHCDCDTLFTSCLQEARTAIADFVGQIFFNLLQLQCFTVTNKEACKDEDSCTPMERRSSGMEVRNNPPYVNSMLNITFTRPF